MKNMIKTVSILTLAISMTACSGMSKEQRRTAVGAAAGAVVGHMLGGDTGAVLGGAALGGVIGNQTAK